MDFPPAVWHCVAAYQYPTTTTKGVQDMKTRERQTTMTDLCNLIAHETVSLLEALDDDGILAA